MTFSSRSEGNPVVILLDLKMPKLDGIQVLRQLKADERMCLIPVITLKKKTRERERKTEGKGCQSVRQ
jgi:two-component system response regulator